MNKTRPAPRPASKLELHRETLRRLDPRDLAGAHGGRTVGAPPTETCPTRPTTRQ
jgi:hypothetical protein